MRSLAPADQEAREDGEEAEFVRLNAVGELAVNRETNRNRLGHKRSRVSRSK